MWLYLYLQLVLFAAYVLPATTLQSRKHVHKLNKKMKLKLPEQTIKKKDHMILNYSDKH